jgi:hypothetical protein
MSSGFETEYNVNDVINGIFKNFHDHKRCIEG